MTISYASPSIVFCVFEVLTVMVSSLRLAFRLKIRRFWWEDMWAAIATIGMIVFAIAMMLHIWTKDPKTNTGASFISSYVFTIIVWSVRMSLLYSIVRVITPSTWLRNFTHVIGASFIVVCTVLVVLKSWCVDKDEHGRSECLLQDTISIFEVIADTVGDTVLVALSLRLLWRVKLPRRQRRMILAIFSSTAIMSMSSLPHCVSQVLDDHFLNYIFTSVEAISSLIVCNLLVVVTYIYRVFSSASESDDSSGDDDFTTPLTGPNSPNVPRNPSMFTTVDLNASNSTTTGTTEYITSGASSSQIA